jgi:transposase
MPPNEEAALIRLILGDAQWERVAPLLPGKAGDPGRTAADIRLV